MQTSNLIYSLLALCSVMTTGCMKYEEAPLVESPAYIRVFNNLPKIGNALYAGQATPFLTMLIDPETDGQGLPNNAGIVGDFLATRQLFSLSYPINAANSDISGSVLSGRGGASASLYPSNFEYPGNAHVLTAPAINGFDLSAWAQIPSGKHRIMFIVRPQNNTPFKNLSALIRGNILIDTTVELAHGEVYTMHVLARDLDEAKYGLYVRKESFVHETFDENKIYAGFVNLSGKQPKAIGAGYGFVYPDRPAIYCTYYMPAVSPNTNSIQLNTLKGFDKTYFTTLRQNMDTAIHFLELPMLPRDSFFLQKVIREYAPERAIIEGGPLNPSGRGVGTLPSFAFHFADAANPTRWITLFSAANPRTFNNYDPVNSGATNFTPNLNLIVNSNNVNNLYSTLNIMEIVYDRVYLMQIQRGFNTVPLN
ncbi:hypothetical protein [Chitinophaga sp. 22620]|uniref:hypothetical protein n=1 Tax=Chitinophaga sp. 22620 TaxID=3453952 RepID=UPI003F853CD6